MHNLIITVFVNPWEVKWGKQSCCCCCCCYIHTCCCKAGERAWKLRSPFVEELKTSSIGSTVSGLVGFFGFCWEKNRFWLVRSTFSTLLRPSGNRWKAFVWLCHVILVPVTTSPRSYRISTDNCWKIVLLRNANRMIPTPLRLTRLIPKEHDFNVYVSILASLTLKACKARERYHRVAPL